MEDQGHTRHPRILFVCTRFGGRALLAQAMAQREAGGQFEFFASGFERAEVGPRISLCAKEIDLDIVPRPEGVETVFERKKSGETFDRVVMMCDPEGNESCELFERHIKVLFGEHVDNRLWAVPDLARLPREQTVWMERARLIRDGIALRVHDFLSEM